MLRTLESHAGPYYWWLILLLSLLLLLLSSRPVHG